MLMTLWQNGPIKYHRWLDFNLLPPPGKSSTASRGSASLNEATRRLQDDWWLIKCRHSDKKQEVTRGSTAKRLQFQGLFQMTCDILVLTKKKTVCTNCRHFSADKCRVDATRGSFYMHPLDSIISLHLICYSITEVWNLITEGDADASYHPTGRSNYSAGRLSWSTIPEWDVCLIIAATEIVLSWKNGEKIKRKRKKGAKKNFGDVRISGNEAKLPSRGGGGEKAERSCHENTDGGKWPFDGRWKRSCIVCFRGRDRVKAKKENCATKKANKFFWWRQETLALQNLAAKASREKKNMKDEAAANRWSWTQLVFLWCSAEGRSHDLWPVEKVMT